MMIFTVIVTFCSFAPPVTQKKGFANFDICSIATINEKLPILKRPKICTKGQVQNAAHFRL